MTSLEKAINLGYLFLTLNPPPPKKHINTCTTLCCMYWYVSIYSEECSWPQYMYHKLSPFNGYHWCPLGKLSHLGLEQPIDTIEKSWGVNCIPREFTINILSFCSISVYVVYSIDKTGTRDLKLRTSWRTTYLWVVDLVFFWWQFELVTVGCASIPYLVQYRY